MNQALYAKEWRAQIRWPAWLAGSWVFRRNSNGEVFTNVPIRIIHHSTDGPEWGYHGSGPADLALNLAHAYLKTPARGGVQCFKGRVAEVTWECHQELKRYFLAGMPRPGASFKRQTVLDWLVDWCRRQQLLC